MTSFQHLYENPPHLSHEITAIKRFCLKSPDLPVPTVLLKNYSYAYPVCKAESFGSYIPLWINQ